MTGVSGGRMDLNLRFAVYGEVRDPVVNNPPVFSSGSNFSVNENNRRYWYCGGF